jgi:hypothetical protein
VAEPAATRQGLLRLRRLLYGVVWCVEVLLLGVLTALGLLTLGVAGSVSLAVLTAGLCVLCASAWGAGPAGPLPVRTADAAVGLTIGLLALVGWLQLAGLRGVVAVGLLPGLLLARPWIGRLPLVLRQASSTHHRSDRCVCGRELADLLGRLPTDVLLGEWERSGRALSAHPGPRAESDLVQLRALILDELERRDGEGFAAWHRAWQRTPGRRPCAPEAFLRDET